MWRPPPPRSSPAQDVWIYSGSVGALGKWGEAAVAGFCLFRSTAGSPPAGRVPLGEEEEQGGGVEEVADRHLLFSPPHSM